MKQEGRSAAPADFKESCRQEVVGKDYYDHSAYFDRLLPDMSDLGNPFQRYRIRKVLEIHRPSRTDRVLDIGCGWGTFCFALSPLVGHVTGLDFSERSIEIGRDLLAKRGDTNVDFICAEAQRTGLDDASFDAIIAADIFEHVHPGTFAEILDECRRLLKPAGKLVIWTPHRGHLLEIMKNRNLLLRKDPGHVDYKSLRRIRKELLARGFAVKKSYYTESHIPVLRTLEKVLLRYIPLFRRRIAVLAENIS